jgi:DNA-3-methyladenine glycosylase II
MDLETIKSILCERDPYLITLFNESHPNWTEIIKAPYPALIGAIIGQKIKYISARKIRGNLYALVGSSTFEPQDIDIITDEQMKNCDCSTTCITTIRNNNLDLSTEIGRLREVPGVGEWTIKTTLLTSFLDLSVFPYDDSFIRNNIQYLYGLSKRPSPKEVEVITRKWEPYQSIVCWYLW